MFAHLLSSGRVETSGIPSANHDHNRTKQADSDDGEVV
jgi:hypothetical protein